MSSLTKQDLKLIALDVEDLAVLAAHLQDAVLRVGDMAYLPAEKRFAAVGNRFDWSSATDNGVMASRRRMKRKRCGIRFERVLGAQLLGIDLKAPDAVMSLLTIGFDPVASDEPEGHITLLFSGGAAIRLHVECIEAGLQDLGAAWRAASKPQHPGGDDPVAKT